MRSLLIALAFTLSVGLFSSCEGPVGPRGSDGLDGGIIESAVYEVSGSFTSGNEYFLQYFFPDDFFILDTDVVLVYLLTGEDNGADVWQLMPQTRYLPSGEILVYNYDYTQYDVSLFLDGFVDLDFLNSSYTRDKIFRIVVVPADFVLNKSIDTSTFESLSNSDEIKLDLKTTTLKSLSVEE